MKPFVTVDESKCVGCGTCTTECSLHLPVSQRGELGGQVDCTRCFHCYAVCPEQAIRIQGFERPSSLESPSSSEREENASRQQLLHLLANRRSVRRYQDRVVDEDTIKGLIHAAGHVPSGGNSHAYRFTVMTKGRIRERLSRGLQKIYRKRRKLFRSPLLRWLLRIFADKTTRAFLRNPVYLARINYLLDLMDRGEDPVFYNAPVVIFVHSPALIPTPAEDGVLTAYNIVLAAESMGLGTCFVSLAQNAVNAGRKCRKILNLSSGERVHAVVVLGYPDVTFFRPVPRDLKPIHWRTA